MVLGLFLILWYREGSVIRGISSLNQMLRVVETV